MKDEQWGRPEMRLSHNWLHLTRPLSIAKAITSSSRPPKKREMGAFMLFLKMSPIDGAEIIYQNLSPELTSEIYSFVRPEEVQCRK